MMSFYNIQIINFINYKKNSKCFLFIVFYFPFFLLLYFSFQKKIMNTYYGIQCVADYLNLLSSNLVNLLLSFVIITASIIIIESNNSYNFLIRIKSRKNILKLQYINMFQLTIIFTIYFFFVAIIIGALLTNNFINWNETSSFYFFVNNRTVEYSFQKVLLISEFKFFAKMIFMISFSIVLNIKFNKYIAYLFLIILNATYTYYLSGTTYVIAHVLGLQENKNSYFPLYSGIIYFCIITLMILCLYIISLYFVRKKDFLNEK